MKAANHVADDVTIDEPEQLDDDKTIDVTQWRDIAEARMEQVRHWARANPIAAVGVALGAGFVIGRMFRR